MTTFTLVAAHNIKLGGRLITTGETFEIDDRSVAKQLLEDRAAMTPADVRAAELQEVAADAAREQARRNLDAAQAAAIDAGLGDRSTPAALHRRAKAAEEQAVAEAKAREGQHRENRAGDGGKARR